MPRVKKVKTTKQCHEDGCDERVSMTEDFCSQHTIEDNDEVIDTEDVEDNDEA